MVGSCKIAVRGYGIFPMILGFRMLPNKLYLSFIGQIGCLLLTKNCNGKQPQTYMFSRLAAISDMSFVIFARANVF